MSCHLECVFTHIFFGGLLFVMGVVDLSFNYGDFWTGLRFFVIFGGAWVGKLSCFPSAVNGSKIRLQLTSPKHEKSTFRTVSGRLHPCALLIWPVKSPFLISVYLQ